MSFSHDRRGQSVVVGTVILFGFLILALSVYQVQFVPAENSEIEFEHSQQVEGDFQDLRNALLSGGTTGEARSTSIRLGTRYPQRTFFLNPPPASGTLETTDERNLSISNATVPKDAGAHENVRDFWENNTEWKDKDGPVFATKSIRYTPNYNEYRGAPELVYENSLVAAEFGDRALPRSSQTIIRDERVSLTTISGEISESGVEAQSVDSETISRGARTIPITGENGENVTISLPTALDNASDLVNRLDHDDFTADEDRINVTLDGGDTYRLALSEVSVDRRGETSPAYIVPVGSRDVMEGQSVGVEVRDKYNNPVQGADVVISDGDDRTTDDDGRVFYTPEPDESTASINGSVDPDKPDYESVRFDVSRGGEGGEGVDPVAGPDITDVGTPDDDEITVVQGDPLTLNATASSLGEPGNVRSGTPISEINWESDLSESGVIADLDPDDSNRVETQENNSIETGGWQLGQHEIEVYAIDASGRETPDVDRKSVTVNIEDTSVTALNAAFEFDERTDTDPNPITVQLEDENGDPIGNEVITLEVLQGEGDIRENENNQGQEHTVQTDADGNFQENIDYATSNFPESVEVGLVDESGDISETITYGVTAPISGTVEDEDGNEIAGADITVTNTETGEERTTETENDGSYDIEVPIGEYDVSADADGFISETQVDIDVSADEEGVENVDFSLQPEPSFGSLSAEVIDYNNGQDAIREININGDVEDVDGDGFIKMEFTGDVEDIEGDTERQIPMASTFDEDFDTGSGNTGPSEVGVVVQLLDGAENPYLTCTSDDNLTDIDSELTLNDFACN